MSRGRALVLAAGTVLAAGSCDQAPQAVSSLAAAEPPNAIVDSILPMPELLRRFRTGLAPSTRFTGGAASRDALVDRFIAAIERNDTATVDALTVTKAEYAYLYFPHSVYAKRPYELPPEIAWMLAAAASDKGRTRVFRRLGGERLRFAGYSCAVESSEGPNTFWRECRAEYTHPGEGRVERRLFGTIMERGGRYKFLSYANDF